ncbi:NAD(P)H-binding protein [Streptomyces sp. NPDC056716]|uniref:NAD(P)H-binding protein n=1 Tax=unclassified Streptomyces TaxID=2593676 RepID=UPI00368D51A8
MATRGIAVTGASGNVGGAVVRGLLAAGETDVLAWVRSPSRLAALERVVDVRQADYQSREGLESALDGVGTLVFISSDGEAAPMLIHHGNVLAAAVSAGVEHVVYLSILDVEADSPFCFAPVHRETERMLRDHGLPHTVVRSSIYSEFFLRWVVEAASTGELALPMRDGTVSLISRDDVARCLVECAVRRAGSLVHATGEESYGLAEVARLAARLGSRPVRPTDIDPTEFAALLLRQHVTPWWTYAFASMFESVRGQRFAEVTGDVAALTGHGPVGFEDIAQRAFQASLRVGDPAGGES